MKNNIFAGLLLVGIVSYTSVMGIALSTIATEKNVELESLHSSVAKLSEDEDALKTKAQLYSNRVSEEKTLVLELEAELSNDEGLLK